MRSELNTRRGGPSDPAVSDLIQQGMGRVNRAFKRGNAAEAHETPLSVALETAVELGLSLPDAVRATQPNRLVSRRASRDLLACAAANLVGASAAAEPKPSARGMYCKWFRSPRSTRQGTVLLCAIPYSPPALSCPWNHEPQGPRRSRRLFSPTGFFAAHSAHELKTGGAFHEKQKQCTIRTMPSPAHNNIHCQRSAATQHSADQEQ